MPPNPSSSIQFPLTPAFDSTLSSPSPSTVLSNLASHNTSSTYVKNSSSSLPSSSPSSLSFSELGVPDWLLSLGRQLQIYEPTPIQSIVLPLVYKGDCVTAVSPTGSGKTICYCWPMLHKLSIDPYGVFGVVILPSRELAEQVGEQFSVFGAAIGLKLCLCIGGHGITEQSLELSQGPHIIIATPGRLADHILNSSSGLKKKLKHVKFLILDEADFLIGNESFQSDLITILNSLPKQDRQTLFFTATLTPKLYQIAFPNNISQPSHLSQNDSSQSNLPNHNNSTYNENNSLGNSSRAMKLADVTGCLSPVEAMENTSIQNLSFSMITPDSLDQSYLFLPKHVHYIYLHHILSRLLKLSPETDDASSTSSFGIIFTRSCQECHYTMILLTLLGYSVTALHALISQRRRRAALMKFRGGLCSLLVATDVASRGLDLPKVDFVINLSFPKTPEVYVHRVGRTARAGKRGLALSFVTEHDANRVINVEENTKITLKLYEDFNEQEALKSTNRVSKAQREAELILKETQFDEVAEEHKKRRTQNKIHTQNTEKTLNIYNTQQTDQNPINTQKTDKKLKTNNTQQTNKTNKIKVQKSDKTINKIVSKKTKQSPTKIKATKLDQTPNKH